MHTKDVRVGDCCSDRGESRVKEVQAQAKDLALTSSTVAGEEAAIGEEEGRLNMAEEKLLVWSVFHKVTYKKKSRRAAG